MSNALSSSYASYGTTPQQHVDSARSHYDLAESLVAAHGENNTTPWLSNHLVEEASLTVHDRTVAEVTVRRLSKEIEHAREELHELEQHLANEMLTPSVRTWLLPLMAVGLLLSLYGSIMSSNSAELGATGLMLLWSLAAFWYIYTRERRVAATADANRAEIEIWSSRIAELEQSLQHHQRMMDVAEQ
jgi:hypothetical protein